MIVIYEDCILTWNITQMKMCTFMREYFRRVKEFNEGGPNR